MTAIWPVLRSWRFELGFAAFTLWMVGCFYIILMDTPADIKARGACDRYVSALINSDNLVEITRATAMIDQLHCRVLTRLP